MIGVTAPPDVIRWSPRSDGHGDCAVAAIELACGVTYEVALAAALATKPDVLTQGLYWTNITAAVEFLGYEWSIKHSDYDLNEDTGILNVFVPRWKTKTDHVVYLWEGRILEPMDSRRQLWLDPQQFLKNYCYKAGALLIVRRKGEQ